MSITTPSDTLLVFARNPVAGRVKTRLVGTLSAQQAADIYVGLLQHTLAVASAGCSGHVRVYIDDDAPNPTLRHMLDRHGLTWHRQQGPDLGTRMFQAIATTLQTATRAVLIGSDCPEFDPDYLHSAFAALSTNDVVIGPAADGGYVLIGMHEPHAELFTDIVWGGSHALAQTRQRLTQQRLTWHELRTLHDVDDAADLARFPQLTGNTSTPA